MIVAISRDSVRVQHTGQAFDPDTATFLDFRANQNKGTRFFCVLPCEENRALVEKASLVECCSIMKTLPPDYFYRVIANEFIRAGKQDDE